MTAEDAITSPPMQAVVPKIPPQAVRVIEPERWSIAYSTGIFDPAQGPARTSFQSARPMVVEMIAAAKVCPDGFLLLESEPIPVPPTDPHCSGNSWSSGEYTKGALFKIPIQNGMVPPTPVELVVQRNNLPHPTYEFTITVQPTTTASGIFELSVVGRFID